MATVAGDDGVHFLRRHRDGVEGNLFFPKPSEWEPQDYVATQIVHNV